MRRLGCGGACVGLRVVVGVLLSGVLVVSSASGAADVGVDGSAGAVVSTTGGFSPFPSAGDALGSDALPSTDVLDRVMARAVEDARVRELVLQTPEAMQARRDSETRFRGLGPDEAAAAAKRYFRADVPLWSPPALLPDERIVEYVADDAMVTVDGAGRRQLVESQLPLLATDRDGVRRAVSLALEDQGAVLRPANPIVETGIDKATGVVGFPGQRIALRPLGAEVSDRPQVVGGRAFFANVATDTDWVVAPLPHGAETFWQLRSPDSPTQLGLEVDIPDGTVLEQGKEPRDGMRVARGEETVATIAAPVATDAQGQTVPVTYRVEGPTVTITVDTSTKDVAYPILVDPVADVLDTGPEVAGDWGWKWTSNANYWGRYETGYAGWGQYQGGAPYQGRTAGDYAEWYYRPIRQSYVSRWGTGYTNVDLGQGQCYIGGISNPQTPGTWHSGGWMWGSNWMAGAGPVSFCNPPSSASQYVYRGFPASYCALTDCAPPSGFVDDRPEFLLWTYQSTFDTLGSALFTSGNVVSIGDDSNPTVTASAIDSSWRKTGAAGSAIPDLTGTISGYDPGVGVKSLQVINGAAEQTLSASCTGTTSNPCPDAFALRPYHLAQHEGTNTITYQVADAMGKNTGTPWPADQSRIDNTPPTGTLQSPGREVLRNSITFSGTMTDPGAPTSGSGTGTWAVEYEKAGDSSWHTACTAAQAPGSSSFSCLFNTTSIDDGSYHLRVAMTDQTEISGPNSATTTPIDVRVENDAQVGAKPSYVIESQKLADRMTIGANVATGNLMVSSRDLSVGGVGVDMSASRVYNSLTNHAHQGARGELGLDNNLGFGEMTLVRNSSDHDETFYDRTGDPWRFDYQAHCDFNPPPGLEATLVCDDDTGGRILRFLETGEKLYFDDHDSSAVTKEVDRHDNEIDYEYTGGSGSGGQLTGITDTQGRDYTVNHSTLSGHDVITSIVDEAGSRTWSYGYDSTGSLLTSVTDPDSHVVHYQYDAAHDNALSQITDGRGNDTFITYDSSERVATIRRDIAGTSNDPTTTFTYQAVNAAQCDTGDHVRQTQVTDPMGGHSYFCITDTRHVTHSQDQIGHEQSRAFNTRENVADFQGSGTGSAQSTAVYEQDATGGSSCGQGSSSKWDNLCSTTAPMGEEHDYGYTHAGWPGDDDIRNYRPTSATSPQGEDTGMHWDAGGNLTDISRSTGGSSPVMLQAQLTYNSDGTIDTTTDANHNVTDFAYYLASDGGHRKGLTKHVTAPAVTSGDQLGTSGNRSLVQYDYDQTGRTASIINGRGQETTLTYDGEESLKTEAFSDGSCFVYIYDANGNTTYRSEYGDCTNQSSTLTATYGYTYDELNRRTSETQPGSVTHSYTYDRNGNMLTLSDDAGTTTYSYNADNTLHDVAEPGGSCTGTISLCTTRTYDRDPNWTLTKFPNGIYVKEIYDSSGKTTAVKAYDANPNSGSPTPLRGFEYDYRNGASSDKEILQKRTNAAGDRITAYGYDGLDRLTDATTVDDDDDPVDEYDYRLDANGNLTRKQHTTGSGSPVNTYYAYNENNLLCWKASSDGTCGTTPSGGTDYGYNRDGDDDRFTYNNRNQTTNTGTNPLSFAGPNQWELTGDDTLTLANDLLGIATTKAASNTTRYTRDPSGSLLARKLPTGAHEYYEQLDNLGSITGLDNSSGTHVATKAYDPYGNITTDTSTTSADRFGYAAGYTSPSSGLMHFGLRWYDPTIARWTQPDQLNMPADLQQANHYAYVGGNPISYTDPDGQKVGCASVGIGHICKAADEAASHVTWKNAGHIYAGYEALGGALVTGGIAAGGTIACVGATAGLGSAACGFIGLSAGSASAGLSYGSYKEFSKVE